MTSSTPQQKHTTPHPLDAAPAAVPLPDAPIPERGRPEPPERVHLKRNKHVADAFGAGGQKVSYPFTAKKGELSLFELVGAAFERGGRAHVRITILDSADRPVWQEERRGGVTWRIFWSFVAPYEGAYRLVLVPVEHPFRFVLVRHSDYTARAEDERLSLGARTSVHSYLAEANDRARFVIELAPGEEVGVKVQGTRAEARQEARLALRGRAREGMRSARQFPVFGLEIEHEGRTVVSGRHFALVRSAAGGACTIEVGGKGCPDGGLFDLEIERALDKRRVFGVVVDSEDRAVPGVRLSFLREPDHDPVGQCVTDADGRYALEVPTGNMVIRMAKSERDARAGRTVQTAVIGGELNVLYLGA